MEIYSQRTAVLLLQKVKKPNVSTNHQWTWTNERTLNEFEVTVCRKSDPFSPKSENVTRTYRKKKSSKGLAASGQTERR